MQDQHAVHFYDHDHQVVDTLTTLVEEGLSRGERVVLIATAEHADELDRSALVRGVSLSEGRLDGRIVVLDAARSLAAFMVDGAPDPDLFRLSVGGVIADAGADGTPVRAFGEMVALLWDQGNVAGALRLEELWNQLAETHAFSLLCAYPQSALDRATLGDVDRVCGLHGDVHAAYAASELSADGHGAAKSAVFVPVPQAVAAARRFVTLVLESWGERDLLADAALITSELATNAVRHAVSPFRTVVDRSRAGVRISIADLEPGEVAAGTADPTALAGRGVAIVEALASQWGCYPAPDGKVVWAELHAASR